MDYYFSPQQHFPDLALTIDIVHSLIRDEIGTYVMKLNKTGILLDAVISRSAHRQYNSLSTVAAEYAFRVTSSLV